jgi:peptidoglycan/xylan/chitin deacetylase (PgdA/CDA1 family)
LAKLFSVRFDVDTHRCVREGMPALAALGKRLDAPFTFFVNMGRAVSRRAALARRSSPASATAEKLSARRKLGWKSWLAAATMNPEVGAGAPDVIVAARELGHEIGLHGGRNHALWQLEAPQWSAERVAAEIDAVLPQLERLLGATPPGFASPGWSTHPALPSLLAARGFRYLADLHGPGDDAGAGVLPVVRTRLAGEPGGVAYLEHLRATGMDDAAVEQRFEEDLERAGSHAVMYDHPYFAGVHELRLVARVIEIARVRGYEVVPVETVARAVAR